MSTISVTPGYLGTKTDRMNLLAYSITGTTMSTITEKVNGVTIGTKTATSGQSLIAGLTQAQWDAVRFGKYADATGGQNTLTIEMGSEVFSYTFDKRPATDADILTATKAVKDSQEVFLPSIKRKLVDKVGGNPSSAFESIIDAISMGKKMASGTTVSSSTNSSFVYLTGQVGNIPSLTVTGLTFKPSTIVLVSNGTTTLYTEVLDAYSNYPRRVHVFSFATSSSTQTNYTFKGDASPANVSATGFTLPVWTQNASYNWLAIE